MKGPYELAQDILVAADADSISRQRTNGIEIGRHALYEDNVEGQTLDINSIGKQSNIQKQKSDASNSRFTSIDLYGSAVLEKGEDESTLFGGECQRLIILIKTLRIRGD